MWKVLTDNVNLMVRLNAVLPPASLTNVTGSQPDDSSPFYCRGDDGGSER